MKKIYEIIMKASNGNFQTFPAARRRLAICSVSLLAFLFAGMREAVATTSVTSVSLTAPFNGQEILAPASISLTAEASSATGTITTVGFYNGTNLLGSDITAPYAYTWTNVAAGSYSLTAQAVENSGAVHTSAVAVIQVSTVVVSTTNFTTAGSTTWRCPENVTSVVVECWGAGGAGGSAARTSGTNTQYGGGGGGGAYAKYNEYPVIPGSNYYITVGAGGFNNFIDNTGRVSGADSWFNTENSPSSIIIAKGGVGGESATTNEYGLGGIGTTNGSAGNIVYAGGSGAAGAVSRAGGGGSSAGTNSPGTSATSNVGATAPAGGGNGGTGPTTNEAVGGQGFAPGGGGSGARSENFLKAGGAGASGQVVLTYKAGFSPRVIITAPTNGSVFTIPATIVLTANASDADGVITNVSFYDGITLLGSDTTAPYAYTLLTNVPCSLNLRAMATDNTGVVRTSAAVRVTVTNVTYALTVTNGTGSGSYTNGRQVAITVSNAPLGKAFDKWIGDTQYLASVTSLSNTVTMSTNPVTLTATYLDLNYALTVNSGTGGGSYTNARQVAIVASNILGKAFDKWIGDTQHVASASSASTTVTMPISNIAVTATYKDVYALSVVDGSGDGLYTNGAQVAISAEAPVIGKAFNGWIGDTQYVASVTSATTTVTMSTNAVTLTATYVDVYYALTVNSGTGGGGSYTNGTQVSISADAPPTGMTFDKWTGDAQFVNNGTYTNALLTMPAQAVALTATYKMLPGYYTLTVNNGTGGGLYTNGTQVAITATNTPESGAVFDRWIGDTQAVVGVFSLNTIVTMPAQNTALTASCVDVSNGVASVSWASAFIYYDPSFDPLLVAGQSTIAQLMYSPDDTKDSILPNGAGAENDVVWDTITLTENGDGTFAYGSFSTNTVRAGTNGYVYALIFQDNNVQPGDLYVAGPLAPLVGGAADVNTCVDPGNGDAINGVNSAQVVGNATYTLTVNNGTGSGTYTNAQVVDISANAPASGTAFSRWTGDTQGVASVTASNTTVTMSTNNVNLTATYTNLPGRYTLAVTNGTGSGAYTNGQKVAILANAIPGKAFDKWIGDTQYLAGATVTMPATNVTLTATYVDVYYALTVTGGSGSGSSYTNGQQVAISAAVISGKTFSRWAGDTQYVASVISANTTVTMPAQAVALTATYTDVLYTLTVTSGSGDGSYTNGQQVAILAEAISGKTFSRWVGNTAFVANSNSASTMVTMPAQAVSLTATYTDTYYPLTVINGTGGGGTHTNGTQVAIVASSAPTGQVFDQWSGDVRGVASVTASNTTVTMPARAVSLTATYKTLYTLTVTNGSGSGSYTNGAVVGPVNTNTPTGQAFAKWIGDTQYLNSVISPNPKLTMPASNISITATYTNRGGWYTLTVVGGSQNGGGVYQSEQQVWILQTSTSRTFVAWTGYTNALSSNTASTMVTMPITNITIIATYSNVILTVTNGSGSGSSYTNSQQVPITASNAPSGQVFDKWTGATQYVAGVTNTNALVTLPAQDITLTATYKNVYTLTVNGGTGSGSYTNGTKVTITNALVPGTVFDKWVGDTQSVASVTSATTTVTMTNANISVTATYKNLHVLTVIGGTGGGSNAVGQQVTIAANAPALGTAFYRWTGATQYVASVTSATTTVTMPDSSITVTANYKETYILTVTGATGGGAYFAGSLVTITAILSAGQDFDRWIGQTQYVANVTSANTTVTMPAADISVGAIYQTAHYALTVTNGTGSGSYTNGQRVAIAATIPTGMTFVKWNDGNTNASRTITMPPAPITYTATVIDLQKPTVKITYPANKSKVMTNGTVIIRGTAADNVGLTGVMHQLYTGEWTNAVTTNGWKNWTANFYPVSGLNTARVYSVDTQGNTSETATVVFTYVPGAVMQVQTNGRGTITPAYNGKVLQIGKSYKMTAKAASGFVFNNWTRGISNQIASSKTYISFVMQSNLVLTANFRSRLETFAMADIAVAAPATPQAAITVDGSAKDWANVPRSSFSYASVTQEVATALDGNNIALLLTGCPFETSDNVLVYFKLRLSYGTADNRHSVDLWTSGSVLYGMVDGQVIAGLEAVLLNGVLEVKLPVEQVPSQVTIEEIGCGMDLGGGTLTELFKIVSP